MEIAKKTIEKKSDPNENDIGKQITSPPKDAKTLIEEKTSEEKPARKVTRHDDLLENPIHKYEPFDPKKELAELEKKLWRKKGESLKTSEKRRLLDDYSQKLMEQKIALSDVLGTLEEEINNNPNSGYDRLCRVIDIFAPGGRLTETQRRELRFGVAEYMSKNAAVEFQRQKHNNDAELFQRCFNKKPAGKIQVIKGPMTLYFRCFDIRDYALILSGDFSGNFQPSEAYLEYSQKSAGVSLADSAIEDLRGCIIAENSQQKDINSGTLRHEEQHAIRRLFPVNIFRGDILSEVAKSSKEKQEVVLKRMLTGKKARF